MMDLDKVIMALGLGFVVALIAFAMCVVYTFFGWLTGYVVSATPLGNLVVDGFNVIGLDATGNIPALGATFGFITGFIKGIVTIKNERGD